MKRWIEVKIRRKLCDLGIWPWNILHRTFFLHIRYYPIKYMSDPDRWRDIPERVPPVTHFGSCAIMECTYYRPVRVIPLAKWSMVYARPLRGLLDF